jgi:phage terminase small subunit
MATPKKTTSKKAQKKAPKKVSPRSTNDKGLNPKQEQFCREYVQDLNAKQAAIRAGYSPKSAEVNGCRLLSHAKVQHRIQELMDDRSHRTEITADVILGELLGLATTDISDMYDEETGTFKPIHSMPKQIRKAISSIQVDELYEGYGKDRVQIGVTKKIKLWDKTKSLELLGKHLKLFVDRVENEHSITDGDVKFVAEWGSTIETTPETKIK